MNPTRHSLSGGRYWSRSNLVLLFQIDTQSGKPPLIAIKPRDHWFSCVFNIKTCQSDDQLPNTRQQIFKKTFKSEWSWPTWTFSKRRPARFPFCVIVTSERGKEKQQHECVEVIHTSVMQPYAWARLVVCFGQLSSDDSLQGLVETKAKCVFSLGLLCCLHWYT